MKFSEYLDHLNAIATDPKTLDMDVVYSKDDEGNEFQKVVYAPGVGYFYEVRWGQGDFTRTELGPNAVVIN